MDEIISLHSSPGWRIPAARWFQEKWEIPLEEYLCMVQGDDGEQMRMYKKDTSL